MITKIGIIVFVWLFDLCLLLLINKELKLNDWLLVFFGFSLLFVATLDLIGYERITVGNVIRSIVVVFLWPFVMLIWLVEKWSSFGVLDSIVLYNKKERRNVWWGK